MPKPFRRLRPVIATALVLTAAPALQAQETDLELVLLADVSGSIDAGEVAFQRDGYARALTDPEVLAAIADTGAGSIVVTYVEWASDQTVIVPWTRISGAVDAAGFAEILQETPRSAFGRNAIGDALLAGKALIEANGIDALRRVIDFSGDSANSYEGAVIADARAAVLDAGITINGLPVVCRSCNGPPGMGDLVAQYERTIIGGTGAFVVAADDRSRFAEAVKRKLILEISGLTPETVSVASRGPGWEAVRKGL